MFEIVLSSLITLVCIPGQFKAGWGNEPNKFGQPEYTHINAKKERVARAIHHGWLTPNTFITVSTFPSMGSVFDFYGSGKYGIIF